MRALAPIVVGPLTCLLTWVFASAVLCDENHTPTVCHRAFRELLLNILEALVPTEVITVGALVLVGGIWWGVRRVKNPPIMVSIKPGKFVKG